MRSTPHASSPSSVRPTMRPLPFSVWNWRRTVIERFAVAGIVLEHRAMRVDGVEHLVGFGQVDVEQLGVERRRVGVEQSLRFLRDRRRGCGAPPSTIRSTLAASAADSPPPSISFSAAFACATSSPSPIRSASSRRLASLPRSSLARRCVGGRVAARRAISRGNAPRNSATAVLDRLRLDGDRLRRFAEALARSAARSSVRDRDAGAATASM